MTLGQRIQELRKRAGLSQEGLGEALGVSRQAVSKWEGDNGVPELDTLIAMSRLFRIPLGQLLGVEEPEGEKEAPAAGGISEEQLEAILRRYAEESRRPEEPEQPQKLPAGSWILAGCAVVLAVVVLAVSIGKIRGVFNTIGNLQSQISSLQSGLASVSGQVNDISGDLRQQVEQALEEGDRLISTFGYEVVDFDPEKETVTLRLDATLKEYTPGSRLQIVADWIKTDETEGQTVGDWMEGPRFSGEMTVPMNFHMDLSVRVEDSGGNIREQYVETAYSGMHPENFELQVNNIMGPVWLKVSYRGRSYTTGCGPGVDYVSIQTQYPGRFRPVEAKITAYVNGTKMLQSELTLGDTADPSICKAYLVDKEKYPVSVKEGDELVVVITVTDDLGRVKEVTHGGIISEGQLKQRPMAAPMAGED